MPYIETYWDYEINKECFKVCGEKGYVHSTDTSLSRADESIDNSLMEYFVIAYDVNVLRDVGTGKIAIYDDGEPITVYSKTTSGGVVSYTAHDFWDWNDQKTVAETVYLQLSYEAEHKIQARYLANKNCLPSKSVIDTVQLETPALFGSTLEYTGDTSFNEGASPSLAFKFTSNNTSYQSDTKTVKVYLDDELISTEEVTLSSGIGTFSVTVDDLDAGQYGISAVFEGDTHNESCNCNELISVGYIITVTDYTGFPIGNDGSLTATVMDYLGNSVDDETVSWVDTNNNVIKSNSANEGVFTVDYSNITIPGYSRIKYGGSVSELIHITPVVVNDITVNPSQAWVAYGETIDVDIELDITDTYGNQLHADGLNVQFNDGVTTSTLSIPMGAHHDPNIIHTSIEGAGIGDRLLSASIIGRSFSCYIDDYWQMWHSGSYEYNQEYKIFSQTFQELSTQYKLKVATDGGTARIGLPTHSRDWELRFLIESVSSSQMYFRFGNQINGEFVGGSYLGTFKRSQVIRIVQSYEDGTVKLYINNSLKKVFTGQVGGNYAYFGIGSGTEGTYMAFDYLNFKLKNTVGSD